MLRSIDGPPMLFLHVNERIRLPLRFMTLCTHIAIARRSACLRVNLNFRDLFVFLCTLLIHEQRRYANDFGFFGFFVVFFL